MYPERAFKYYQKFLLADFEKRRRIYTILGFDLAGLISSRDWEVFCAILVGEKAKNRKGSDLKTHEVKSALEGNSFEYQYHRHTGLNKYQEDSNINHLFVSYRKDYRSVIVYLIAKEHFTILTNGWLNKIKESYHSGTPKQRCRESISYNMVLKYGKIVFQVVDGMAQGLKT